jgi:hypothetical protein
MDGALLEYGLPGIIIAVLLTAVRVLYVRNNQLSDARLQDVKDFSEQTFATVEILKRAIDVVERREGRDRA